MLPWLWCQTQLRVPPSPGNWNAALELLIRFKATTRGKKKLWTFYYPAQLTKSRTLKQSISGQFQFPVEDTVEKVNFLAHIQCTTWVEKLTLHMSRTKLSPTKHHTVGKIFSRKMTLKIHPEPRWNSLDYSIVMGLNGPVKARPKSNWLCVVKLKTDCQNHSIYLHLYILLKAVQSTKCWQWIHCQQYICTPNLLGFTLQINK